MCLCLSVSFAFYFPRVLFHLSRVTGRVLQLFRPQPCDCPGRCHRFTNCCNGNNGCFVAVRSYRGWSFLAKNAQVSKRFSVLRASEIVDKEIDSGTRVRAQLRKSQEQAAGIGKDTPRSQSWLEH